MRFVKFISHIGSDGFGNEMQVDQDIFVSLYKTNAPKEIIIEANKFAEKKVIEDDPEDEYFYDEEFMALIKYMVEAVENEGFILEEVTEEIYTVNSDINRNFWMR